MAASTLWGATSVPVHQGTNCTGTGKTVLVCSSTAPLWLIQWHTLSFPLPIDDLSHSPSYLCHQCVILCGFHCPSELVKCPPGLVAPKATLTCSKTGKKESCSLTCASKAHYLAGMSQCNHQTEVLFNSKTLNIFFACDLLQSLTTATLWVVASQSSEGSHLPGSTPAAVRAA